MHQLRRFSRWYMGSIALNSGIDIHTYNGYLLIIQLNKNINGFFCCLQYKTPSINQRMYPFFRLRSRVMFITRLERFRCYRNNNLISLVCKICVSDLPLVYVMTNTSVLRIERYNVYGQDI